MKKEHRPRKETDNSDIDKVERTKRSIKRGGSWMRDIMKTAIEVGGLSGEGALAIFNTYGVGLDVILLIAHSHGFVVDELRFEYLLDCQKKISKGMKQCNDK